MGLRSMENRRRTAWGKAAAGTLMLALVVASCAREDVAERFQPVDSHQRYTEALQSLGIGDSAVASQWVESAEEALQEPTPVLPPVTETVYFDPREGEAAAFEFPVPRGQEVEITIDTDVQQYFADIYRIANEMQGNRLESPVHVASSSGEGRIVFVPRRSGRYLLRVQPEILRGGRFDIQIDSNATLSWPVPGTDRSHVISVFGDPRAGGRTHHGIDIYNSHGAPVVAVSDSRVRSVGERDRGGNVVTLVDERVGINIYYAHLSRQTTTRDLRVQAGEQIGLIGNTGNAQGTTPHLHIGIYDGGWGRPADPWYFFVDGGAEPPAPTAEGEMLGQWVRTVPDGAGALLHPPAEWGGIPSPAAADGRGNRIAAEAEPQTSLEAGEEVSLAGLTPAQQTGARGSYLRLRVVGGRVLYAAQNSVEPIDEPVATVGASSPRYLRAAPGPAAEVVGRTDPDTELSVLGYSGDYAMVRVAGRAEPAWIWLPARAGSALTGSL